MGPKITGETEQDRNQNGHRDQQHNTWYRLTLWPQCNFLKNKKSIKENFQLISKKGLNLRTLLSTSKKNCKLTISWISANFSDKLGCKSQANTKGQEIS